MPLGKRVFWNGRRVNPYIRPPLLPNRQDVVLDIAIGYASVVLGTLFVVFSGPLATLMREGDDGWRERGWTQAYEPDVGFLESDRGRWWIFRCWLLLSAAGFLVIGAGLLFRAFL
jgi:hypothetical protein